MGHKYFFDYIDFISFNPNNLNIRVKEQVIPTYTTISRMTIREIKGNISH
jgi:hypothetical protein